MTRGDYICDISYLPSKVAEGRSVVDICGQGYVFSLNFSIMVNMGRECHSCGKKGTYLGVAGDQGKEGTPVGVFCDDGDPLTLDHVVPQVAGGAVKLKRNLTVMCGICNHDKGCTYEGKTDKALHIGKTFRCIKSNGRLKGKEDSLYQVYLKYQKYTEDNFLFGDMEDRFLKDAREAVGHPVKAYARYFLYPAGESTKTEKFLNFFGLTLLNK